MGWVTGPTELVNRINLHTQVERYRCLCTQSTTIIWLKQSSVTYLPTYLPTNLPTYIPAYLLHPQATNLHVSGPSQLLVQELLQHWGEDGFEEHVRQVCSFYY
jgi:hypothetical protein